MRFRTWAADREGATAVMFATTLSVIVAGVGMAVDISRAVDARYQLQGVVDAATLAAAGESDASLQQATFDTFVSKGIAAHGLIRAGSVASSFTPGSASSSGTITASVDVTFAKMFGVGPIAVEANATVAKATPIATEVAMVLDVSSSMIEQGRFAPMQEAVDTFLSLASSSASVSSDWKISIVPFSSRISFGIGNAGFRQAFNGVAATPDRWTNPTGTYNPATYTRVDWPDGVNFAMYNGKNYYWMGCVEPRADVAAHSGSSITAALGEDDPASFPFAPMDANPQSGKSFCPPPVTPLTSDFGSLRTIAAALTSQGSTRLDTGMLGGWYTLSPDWESAWDAASAPASYGAKRKIVVFMTDGQMNTQDDPASKHYDWLCEASGTCDDYANARLTDVCTAMKAQGITIYTVAYDPDADQNFIKSCASSEAHFYQANSGSGDNAIKSVYAAIAGKIFTPELRLIR